MKTFRKSLTHIPTKEINICLYNSLKWTWLNSSRGTNLYNRHIRWWITFHYQQIPINRPKQFTKLFECIVWAPFMHKVLFQRKHSSLDAKWATDIINLAFLALIYSKYLNDRRSLLLLLPLPLLEVPRFLLGNSGRHWKNKIKT